MQSKAAVFPGQGGQVPGMGQRWRTSADWSVVDEVTDVVGCDIEYLLLAAGADELRRTDRAQLAMFTVGVIAYRDAVRQGHAEGISAYAGHSLGEYVALVAAGALSLSEAATVVAARGEAMLGAANSEPGTMVVVVGEDLDRAVSVVDYERAQGAMVWVANLNGSGQIVLAGSEDGIGLVTVQIEAMGMRAIRIPVGGAFHTPMMGHAQERLAEALSAARFEDVHRPVVANVDARAYGRGETWRGLLVQQVVSPVLWANTLETLVAECNCPEIVEFGQAKALTALSKRSGLPITARKYDRPHEEAS